MPAQKTIYNEQSLSTSCVYIAFYGSICKSITKWSPPGGSLVISVWLLCLISIVYTNFVVYREG